MRYADLRDFVAAGLEDLDYDPLDPSFPVLSPGPPTLDLLKLAPGRQMFLGLGGGPGLTSEELFDRIFISTRVIGQQNDYDDAENLAKQLDTMLLRIDSNGKIGEAPVLYVVRAGGSPTLLERDTSARYHFTCTYITETQTGL